MKQLCCLKICYTPHADINECTANTDGCDQGCVNTVGSFVCSCNNGYTLTSDGKTCSGKMYFNNPAHFLALIHSIALYKHKCRYQ